VLIVTAGWSANQVKRPPGGNAPRGGQQVAPWLLRADSASERTYVMASCGQHTSASADVNKSSQALRSLSGNARIVYLACLREGSKLRVIKCIRIS